MTGFMDENGYRVYAPADPDMYLGGMFPVIKIDKDSGYVNPKFQCLLDFHFGIKSP